jgi:hypothetical protein
MRAEGLEPEATLVSGMDIHGVAVADSISTIMHVIAPLPPAPMTPTLHLLLAVISQQGLP